MPTINEFIWSILTSAQHSMVSQFALTRGNIAKTANKTPARRSTRKTATRARTKKTAAAPTGNNAATLNYLGQHPTAAYTQARFGKSRRSKTGARTFSAGRSGTLTKAGKLAKKGNAWSLANIDRSLTSGQRKAA